MLKIAVLFFSLLFFQTLWAGSILMTHEKFVHLSDKEKEQVIIKTMQLVVELESQYKHQVSAKINTSKTKEKLYSVLKTLNDMIMNSAYAADPKKLKNWESFGNDFLKAFKNGKDEEECIYAGWISTMVNDVCVHPSISSNEVAKKAYLASVSKTCASGGIKKIVCNPVIFGFAKQAESSLFCVDAGKGAAQNSSMACMNEALKESSPSADSKSDRVGFLIEKLNGNSSIADGVQKYVMQACLCDTKPDKLSSKYHTYMQPHRTCYGLMKMMGQSYGQDCHLSGGNGDIFSEFEQIQSKNFSDFDDDVQASMKKYDKRIELDDKYSALLNQLKGSPDVKAQIQTLCGGPAPEPDKTQALEDSPCCEATCSSKKDDKGNVSCKFAVTIPGKDPISKEMSVDLKNKKDVYSLSLDDPKVTVDCPITIADDNNEIQCTMSLAIADGKLTATANYDLGDEKLKGDPNWNPAPNDAPKASATTAVFDLKAEDNSVSVSMSNALESGKTLECAGEWNKDEKNSITLKGDAPTVVSVNIKAELKLGDKVIKESDLKDYTIVWYRKGAENLALPSAPAKKKEDAKMKGIASDTTDDTQDDVKKNDLKKDDPKKDEMKKDEVQKGGPAYSAPRSDKGDYKVCADLIGKDTISGNCINVPKMAPANNFNQPMQRIRQGDNTSAQGVL